MFAQSWVHVFYEQMSGKQLFATGGLPKQPAGYTYITLQFDVWFLVFTVGGGLVCFVTVGGVYVYAVECMSMCVAGRLVGRVIPPTI